MNTCHASEPGALAPWPQAKQRAGEGGPHSSVLVLLKWGTLFPTGLSGTIHDKLREASVSWDKGPLLLGCAECLGELWILSEGMERQWVDTL